MGFLVKSIKLILPVDGLGRQPVYRRTINVEKVLATEFKSNHGDAPEIWFQNTKYKHVLVCTVQWYLGRLV